MTALPVLIAVDPGTQKSAMVVVAPSSRGRVTVVRADMVAATCDAMAGFIDEVIAQTPGGVAMMAVEWAVGHAYNAYRVPALLASQGIAGELAALGYDRDITVVKVSALSWRAAVVGHMPRPPKMPRGVKVPKPKYDDLIARALPSFVDGMMLSNVHVRDALGLAVWASRSAFRWAP